MSKDRKTYPAPDARARILAETRNLKMAESSHRFVRGATVNFYEWLDQHRSGSIPEGPPIWICGDCHIGNLGPLSNAAGHVEVQIRDLDQTVIGNPAHDLVRLGLSLASAMRGSDLPGVATARMLEAMIEGYQLAFQPDFDDNSDLEAPQSVKAAINQSVAASWKTLAADRIEDAKPTIPLGKRYWPISSEEKTEILELFATDEMKGLATILRSREDGAEVDVMDAAYWMKGCSSLGRLRYAVLLRVGGGRKKSKRDFCLMDIKEATEAAAPRVEGAQMPADDGARVVEGARHLSPHLGKRMRASHLLGKSVFVRELRPQDLKLEIQQLTRDEAVRVAGYLAAIVGKAHSRQMDAAARKAWQDDLSRNRTRNLDAPNWLWRSVVDLLADHERAYLDHCRRWALQKDAAA